MTGIMLQIKKGITGSNLNIKSHLNGAFWNSFLIFFTAKREFLIFILLINLFENIKNNVAPKVALSIVKGSAVQPSKLPPDTVNKVAIGRLKRHVKIYKIKNIIEAKKKCLLHHKYM